MIFFHLYIRYSLYVVQVQKSSMVVIYVDFSRLELCAAIGALEQFKLYLADRWISLSSFLYPFSPLSWIYI